MNKRDQDRADKRDAKLVQKEEDLKSEAMKRQEEAKKALANLKKPNVKAKFLKVRNEDSFSEENKYIRKRIMLQARKELYA